MGHNSGNLRAVTLRLVAQQQQSVVSAGSGQSVRLAGAEIPAATERGMMDVATASKAALIEVPRRAMTDG